MAKTPSPTPDDQNPVRKWFQFKIWAMKPKADSFFDLLDEQARIAVTAANKLRELEAGDVGAVVAFVQDLEHQGDDVIQRFEVALASTFVTPLDREDIHALSLELEEVIDRLNRSARAFPMYGLARPTPAMVQMIALLSAAVAKTAVAVTLLREHDFPALQAMCREIKAIESQGDQIAIAEIKALFAVPGVYTKHMRAIEMVVKQIESALNHAEDLADKLNNWAVKHG